VKERKNSFLAGVLEQKSYLPILRLENGDTVTPENWEDRKKEMRELLETYSYGKTPDGDVKVWGEIISEDVGAYAGKVVQQKVNISFETKEGVFSFPVEFFIPKKE